MSDFQIIPEELLALATPAERKAYGRALRRHVALLSAADFGLATDPKFRDWPHVRLISDRIEALQPGGRLLILAGPRSGKSFIVSQVLPALLFARDPNVQVLAASYAHDLASTFGRRVRNTILANPDLCPPLDPNAKAQDAFYVAPDKGTGFYRAVGVGGSLTGLGAHYLLLDDLVKNAAEANSQIIRDSTWEWLTSTAMSRLEPGARVVGCMTPWHEDDVTGRIIASGEFEVLRLPALAEDDDPLGRQVGEALNPERYTVEDYEQIRSRDPRVFAALYQGRPSPAEGDLFKADNLVDYDPTKLPEKGLRFATVDLAHSLKQRADYSVITCFLATPSPGPKLYITHMFRAKVDSGRHMAWFDECMASIPQKDRPVYAGIEDKTFGSTLLSVARQQDRRGKVPLRPLKADSDKVTRAQPAITLSTQGQLLFPKGAPWAEDAKQELLLFNNGLHDDIVDTIAYGAIEFGKRGRRTGSPEPKKPPTKMERIDKLVKGRKKAQPSRRKALMSGM